MKRSAAGLATLAAVILTAGCASKPPQEVPVGGRVENASGKPLPKIALRFHAQDEANKQAGSLTCMVQDSGEFTGKCLPGRYKVTVLPLSAGRPGAAPKPPTGTWGRYTSPTGTPWEVTVPSAGKTDLVLKVQ
jgi:hypothetical protein